jgi:hypothetical protein
MSSNGLAAATRDLLAACVKARAQLRPSDAQLAVEISTAIGAAKQALDEHDQHELQAERNRTQIRELARRRKGFQP